MDNIPKELEETQLHLQVVIDPKTKCFTMKTHIDDISKIDVLPPDIIPNDPLQGKTPSDVVDLLPPDIIPKDPLQRKTSSEMVDLSKMNELERLIYNERERILNLRKPKKYGKKSHDYEANSNDRQTDSATSGESDENTKTELSQNEKSKLRMRKLRERETSEERDCRRFRQRIVTMKIRLLQRLKNFDNETYLKEITMRNTAKIRQKRKELKDRETPEQRALRRSKQNVKSRLRNIRRKAFKTPEELAEEKERRLESLEKYWSRQTEPERQARQELHRDKARDRYRKNNEEWKKFDMFLKGAPMEILDKQ